MPRATRKPPTEAPTLPQVVDQYFDLDLAEKAAAKLKKPLNELLKKEMKEGSLTELSGTKAKAIYSVQERTSLLEEKLLQKLKDLGHTEAIVVRETVDQNAVTQLMYDGVLPAEFLADCIETKEVQVLNIKKL
jgi:uncharacterized protein (DUF2344 family)